MSGRVLNSDQRAVLDRTDHDDESGLSLFHFKTNMVYEGELAECGQMRGVVVDKENEVVYEFFTKHTEWTAGDEDGCPNPEEDLNDYEVFLAVEAALLRLFHYNGKWFLSTNRRLDAFQSRWSSKYSFGEMFEYTLKYMFPEHEHHVLDYFFGKLDTSLQYAFLIRFNNDNRIVCQVQNIDLKDRLIFLGTFSGDRSVLEHAHDRFMDHPVLSHLGRQKRMTETFETLKEWEKYIVEEIDPMKNPGVIFIHKTLNKQLKVVHPHYTKCVKLRGNQPNLALRYLEIRHEHGDLEKFCELYERNTKMFHQIEEMLKEIARRINFWYTERYVHNRFVSVPFPEYNIMKKCHQWYLEDPQNRRVYIRVVIDFLNKETPLFLYRMINRVRQENHRHVPFRPPLVRRRIISSSSTTTTNHENEKPAVLASTTEPLMT